MVLQRSRCGVLIARCAHQACLHLSTFDVARLLLFPSTYFLLCAGAPAAAAGPAGAAPPPPPRPDIGPVLVVCFTNHALDSFLEGLLDAGVTQQIVRVGSNSRVERLQQFNLRNLQDRVSACLHVWMCVCACVSVCACVPACRRACVPRASAHGVTAPISRFRLQPPSMYDKGMCRCSRGIPCT